MRITAQEHPEAIKRFAHVKPARGRKGRRCSARCPGVRRTCTREHGHRGPHVAHGRFRKVVAVWDAGAAPARGPDPKRLPTSRTPRREEKRRPVGLPPRAPVGIVEVARDLAARALSSWDQVAFVVLFIVFVKFAIDVLMTLR